MKGIYKGNNNRMFEDLQKVCQTAQVAELIHGLHSLRLSLGLSLAYCLGVSII